MVRACSEVVEGYGGEEKRGGGGKIRVLDDDGGVGGWGW